LARELGASPIPDVPDPPKPTVLFVFRIFSSREA
jgi:hypothetical protein